MVHEPDPRMWETYVWKTLAVELFSRVAATDKLRSFGVDVDPSCQRPHVILTTSARTATLKFADPTPSGPSSKGHTDRCVECGSGRVRNETSRGELLCGPCYDGDGWPDHPRKGRMAPVGPSDTVPESEVHIHPGGLLADLINPVKDAGRFTIGGRR